MNYFLPDWMFAAFAIGGWEGCNYLKGRLPIPHLMWVGWGIAAVCVFILAWRYVLRFFQRLRHRGEPVEDPDDWKNY